MSLIIIAAAVVVVTVVAWFAWCAKDKKPAYFRKPIPSGQFRLIARDEMGGTEINRVVDDFPSFEEAQREAAKGRADSELQVGSNGNPTKFLIYDEREAFIGDWTGRQSAP